MQGRHATSRDRIDARGAQSGRRTGYRDLSRPGIDHAPGRALVLDDTECHETEGTCPSDVVACFTAGTSIATPMGPRPIEMLAPGHLVMTQDHGFQALRWIGSTTRRFVDAIRPVRIRAGALAEGVPRRDLLVSPQHGMVVRSRIAAALTGRLEILVPAVKLIGLPGIEQARDVDTVTYLHLLFDSHEIVFAEDAPTESLMPRPHILGSFGPEAEDELRRLFPDLDRVRPLPARSIPIATLQDEVAQHHLMNQMPVLAV